MKIAILLMLFAITATLPIKAANSTDPAGCTPTGELIYYPDCGGPPTSGFLAGV
jgi:hypothetical protein